MRSLPIEAARWLAGSNNKKTGNVPTLWIGRTLQETGLSCVGCALAPRHLGGVEDCYAWGTPARALRSIQAAAARDPERYTVNKALSNSKRSAKMARLGAIGAPGPLPEGGRVAVKVPWEFLGDEGTGRFKTPGGAAGVICPAVKTDNDITCNDCRLCDGSKTGPVIAFPDHGPKWRHKLRSKRAKSIARTKKAAALLERLDRETT